MEISGNQQQPLQFTAQDLEKAKKQLKPPGKKTAPPTGSISKVALEELRGAKERLKKVDTPEYKPNLKKMYFEDKTAKAEDQRPITTRLHDDPENFEHMAAAGTQIASDALEKTSFSPAIPRQMQSESLESMFLEEIVPPEKIDFTKKLFAFDPYLSPNETEVLGVRDHLRRATMPGIIVSTGTERSFFDLILSPEGCEGLVVIDIDPHVKAYVDFNTLLLRIAKNREQYKELSKHVSIDSAEYTQRIEKIEAIMNNPDTNLPPKIKKLLFRSLKRFCQNLF